MTGADEGEGLTSSGYWAMLANAGIGRMHRMPGSVNWMAQNRDDEKFPVRDPADLEPLARRQAAERYISLYGS